MKHTTTILFWITATATGAETHTTRGIVPEEFVQARPAAASKAPVAKPKYRPVSKSSAPLAAAVTTARQVGVTIWKLRPAASADSGGVRILVQEDGSSVDWIPERISPGTNLAEGARVRLTIESPSPGYLYVIDRERYANGETGPPYLIFPTSRTRQGDNKVAAGMLIDIPGQDDRPNFFTMRHSRANQISEELTVLVTPQPLEGVTIGPKAVLLSNEQVTRWENSWGNRKVETFELTGGAGKVWTRAEQQAAADTTRVLTQDDPPPQTVYRVVAGPGDPILVKVALKYSTAR
jgi:hypothetical protein